uniref:AlNc14C57G4278 protein n=1 Tax=Albugo laibachii Nc14 TaxID=890382 RepID=F0WC95_9STRA|nr:AlNc14C57G4278 [Albugo laibachii Nc14]|eukprot:CCA18809.1 AlNc14C57G4278 [Albugo laibachii Nc14]
MCEYGMKEFQVALSALADVESVFKKRCHQDLARALKSINSSNDASVDFISHDTKIANPEAKIVDSHAQEDDHKALDHAYSPVVDIVEDVSSENARAVISSDGDDPHPAGTARTSESKTVMLEIIPGTADQSRTRVQRCRSIPHAQTDGRRGDHPRSHGHGSGGLVKRSKVRTEKPPAKQRRPKQTQKDRKVKNNATLALARDAVTMHQEQLSFVTIQQILSDVVTYRMAAELLRKVSIHLIPTVTKTPNAFNAFNAKNQAAVEISGIGIYTPLSLNLMSRWHKAVVVLDQVDAAEEWLKSFEGEPMIGLSDPFQVKRRINSVNQLHNLNLMSYDMDLLSLVGKSPLIDGTVAAVLRRLFQAGKGVTLMPALLAVASDSNNIREMFDNNVTAHEVVFLNLGNDHCNVKDTSDRDSLIPQALCNVLQFLRDHSTCQRINRDVTSGEAVY